MPTYFARDTRVSLAVSDLVANDLNPGPPLDEKVVPVPGQLGHMSFLGDCTDPMPFLMVRVGKEMSGKAEREKPTIASSKYQRKTSLVSAASSIAADSPLSSLAETPPRPDESFCSKVAASASSKRSGAKKSGRGKAGSSKATPDQFGQASAQVATTPQHAATERNQGVSEALSLTVSLSRQSYIEADPKRPSTAQSVKIEVFFNGELAASTYAAARYRHDSERTEFIFAGRRVHRLGELPWIMFSSYWGSEMRAGQNTKAEADDEAGTRKRWQEIGATLLKEANRRGFNEKGDRPPIGQYLSALAGVGMPEIVIAMQNESKLQYGVIDIVLSLGEGKKHAADTHNLLEPTRMEDDRYKIKDEENNCIGNEHVKEHQSTTESAGQATLSMANSKAGQQEMPPPPTKPSSTGPPQTLSLQTSDLNTELSSSHIRQSWRRGMDQNDFSVSNHSAIASGFPIYPTQTPISPRYYLGGNSGWQTQHVLNAGLNGSPPLWSYSPTSLVSYSTPSDYGTFAEGWETSRPSYSSYMPASRQTYPQSTRAGTMKAVVIPPRTQLHQRVDSISTSPIVAAPSYPNDYLGASSAQPHRHRKSFSGAWSSSLPNERFAPKSAANIQSSLGSPAAMNAMYDATTTPQSPDDLRTSIFSAGRRASSMSLPIQPVLQGTDKKRRQSAASPPSVTNTTAKRSRYTVLQAIANREVAPKSIEEYIPSVDGESSEPRRQRPEAIDYFSARLPAETNPAQRPTASSRFERYKNVPNPFLENSRARTPARTPNVQPAATTTFPYSHDNSPYHIPSPGQMHQMSYTPLNSLVIRRIIITAGDRSILDHSLRTPYKLFLALPINKFSVPKSPVFGTDQRYMIKAPAGKFDAANQTFDSFVAPPTSPLTPAPSPAVPTSASPPASDRAPIQPRSQRGRFSSVRKITLPSTSAQAANSAVVPEPTPSHPRSHSGRSSSVQPTTLPSTSVPAASSAVVPKPTPSRPHNTRARPSKPGQAAAPSSAPSSAPTPAPIRVPNPASTPAPRPGTAPQTSSLTPHAAGQAFAVPPLSQNCIITYASAEHLRPVKKERGGWFKEESILMGVRYLVG